MNFTVIRYDDWDCIEITQYRVQGRGIVTTVRSEINQEFLDLLSNY
jgi:hypothetical protein